MPYTPTSPTLTLCDNLVTYLQTQWGPLSPNVAMRRYLWRVDLSKVEGRLVMIFPVGYTNGPAERGHDFYEHHIRVVIARRYTAAADPDETVPREWVDQEADFVQRYIVEGFDWTHDTTFGALAPFNRNLQTLTNDLPELYDAEILLQKKEFWCEVDLTFRELILT